MAEKLTKNVVVEKGRPIWLVDVIGNALSVIHKLAFWDRRIGNRNIPYQVTWVVNDFCIRMGLQDVTVRINQYNPIGEIKTLISNDKVHPAWRIILGPIHVILYTLYPWRLIGGDGYVFLNNTVHIFSGVKAITKYAFEYLWNDRDVEAEQEAYRILFPAYSTYLVNRMIPANFQFWVLIPFLAVAHIVGRVLASYVPDRVKREKRELLKPPPPTESLKEQQPEVARIETPAEGK
ncbi:MAG: hypothetical protein ACYTFG_22485 [Planctomycetota bacterium]|jgi:hypothetical protein